MNWLRIIPWWLLIAAAAVLGVAPFGESHLVQKSRMLVNGTLRRPIDWFDLLMHGSPLLLLVLKGIDALRRR